MSLIEFKNLYGYQFPIHDLFERYQYHDTEKFYIYDDGLDLPVFHIIPDDEYIDICICLFEPRYYQYNHKVYKYAIDTKELDKFLRHSNDKYCNKTNWEWLVDRYQSTYSDKSLKKYNIKEQPNYTRLDNNPIKRRSLARWLKAKWYA